VKGTGPKSPEDKIVLMLPKLLKIIKKCLPLIRSKYAAKELTHISLQIIDELKLIQAHSKTK